MPRGDRFENALRLSTCRSWAPSSRRRCSTRRVRPAARRDGLHRRKVERTQHVRPDELEVLSLVEPYKLKQNSLTLVRRTGRPSA